MPPEKERFCEENLVQNTKQPGMLKTPVGLKKNVSNALSNVLIHRSNMHTDRILRDNLSPGLNNQKTISVTILQCSDNHYEGGETWWVMKKKEKGKKKASHYFINIHLPKSRTPTIQLNTLQLSKEKRKKLSPVSWRLNMLIINTACKPVNS